MAVPVFFTPGPASELFIPPGSAQRAQGPVDSPAVISGEGLVARFSPIAGITPRGALNKSVWLPAVLNTWTIVETALHNEYDTLSGGHFSQPAMGDGDARQFQTVNPDTMVVAFDAPYLVATGQDPNDVRTQLKSVLRYRKPVHLLVVINPNPWGWPPEVDMYCTLRQTSEDVRPGEGESRYLTINISEWRDPSSSRRTATPTSGTSRKKGVKLPTTHKLTAADTLDSLSYEYYGRYDHWRDIRDANGVSAKWGQKTPLVQQFGHWRVGYKVKIPKVSK